MQNSTGCRINVSSQFNSNDQEREISLAGNRDAIARARQAIDEKVEASVNTHPVCPALPSFSQLFSNVKHDCNFLPSITNPATALEAGEAVVEAAAMEVEMEGVDHQILANTVVNRSQFRGQITHKPNSCCQQQLR
jgi:hypothetical protein